MRKFDPLNNIDVFDVKLFRYVMERQLFFKILSVSFTSTVDRGSKLLSRNFEPGFVL